MARRLPAAPALGVAKVIPAASAVPADGTRPPASLPRPAFCLLPQLPSRLLSSAAPSLLAKRPHLLLPLLLRQGSSRPAIFAAAGMPEPVAAPKASSEGRTRPRAGPGSAGAIACCRADSCPRRRLSSRRAASAPAGGGGAPPSGGGQGWWRFPAADQAVVPPPPGGGAGAGGGQGGGASPSGAPPGGARIGDKLVEMGLISKDQLQVALYDASAPIKLIGTLLVELGFITESALSAVLASASGFERFDAAATVVEPELLKRFPKDVGAALTACSLCRWKARRCGWRWPTFTTCWRSTKPHRPFRAAGLRDQFRWSALKLKCFRQSTSTTGYEFSIDGILREIETGKHDTSDPGTFW